MTMDVEPATLSEAEVFLPEQESSSDLENQQKAQASPLTSRRLIITLLAIGTICALAVVAGRSTANELPAATPSGIMSLASVQSSWGNHFASFGSKNLAGIAKDYTENSVIRFYDYESKQATKYVGLAGVNQLFTALFATLSDTSGLKAPVIEVEQWANGGMVLLVWLCPSSGLPLVTDTFIFGPDSKILRQNIVNFKGVPGAITATAFTGASSSPCNRRLASVEETWTNHFNAFKAKDLAKIALDYTDKSVIRFYDFKAKQLKKFEGLTGVNQLFTSLFATLTDTSSLQAPVIKVDPAGNMVFLVFSCPTSGLPLVTATFVFDPAFKIFRQTVVSWPSA